MSAQQPAQTRNSVARWALGLGAAGLFGGLLVGISKGGSFAFAVGLAVPVGLFTAIAGAIVGLLVKAASMHLRKAPPVPLAVTTTDEAKPSNPPERVLPEPTTPDEVQAAVHAGSCVGPSEEVWSLALIEFDGPARRAGIWAKAYATAHGDGSMAKAYYLEWRATELQHQREAHALAAATAEQQANAARKKHEAELLILGSIAARCPSCEKAITMADSQCPYCRASFGPGSPYKLKPHLGACPNCATEVSMNALQCPNCKADFGAQSGWRPRSLS